MSEECVSDRAKYIRIESVEDLVADVLGKWCSRCGRYTTPYVAEDNTYPCCNGCWQTYP